MAKTTQEVLEAVKAAIAGVMRLDRNGVKVSDTFEQLRIEFSDVVDIIAKLEETLSTTDLLSQKSIQEIDSVAGLAACVVEHLRAAKTE